MARPVWSGTISFGLVAIPVKLYHAVRRQSVSFNQLDERDLARIRYRKVNAETGDEVPEDHIVKGYEIAKGRYVVVDPEDLEPYMPVATKMIDLQEFVDLEQIDGRKPDVRGRLTERDQGDVGEAPAGDGLRDRTIRGERPRPREVTADAGGPAGQYQP